LSAFLQHYPAALFLPFFVALWLAVVVALGRLSGWPRLASRFPDRPEEPTLRLRWQSGSMGMMVNMRGVLALDVCQSGLRVGIMRLFGPFSRDFFVPWEDISIVRKVPLFWPVATLQFGRPAIGSLTVSARAADRLARAASGRWPETPALPEE